MNTEKITEQNWKEKFRAKWKRIEENYKKHLSGKLIWDADPNDDEPNYLYVEETLEDFIQSIITSIKQEERERIKNIATKYTAWTASYVKAISYGAEPEAAKNISKWHQARWEEFIQSLTEEDGKEKVT